MRDSDVYSLVGGFPMGKRWAAELIADILPKSAAARAQPHHLAPITSALYRAVWLLGEERSGFHRRVRAGVRVLEDGFNAGPAAFAEVFGGTGDRIGNLQQTEHNLHMDAWEVDAKDPDRRFRTILALYKMTYERYYPTLAAPFVVAHRLAPRVADAEDVVRNDGRVNLSMVRELESERGVLDGSFTAGLDRHLRNSIAHDHFDIVTDDEISMWDMQPSSGAITWGPIRLTYMDLRARVHRLSITATVLITAFMLFDIEYGQIMYQRGWLVPVHRARRSDVLASELADMASLHGFRVENVRQESTALELVLRVAGHELPDQESEVIAGGAGRALRFTQRLKTYYAPAWKQVYGFLQTTFDLHAYYDGVTVRLLGADAHSDMGRLVASRDLRLKLVPGNVPAEDLRSQADEDSLSEDSIPVVMHGIPR